MKKQPLLWMTIAAALLSAAQATGTSPAGDIHGRYRANRHNGTQPWRKNTEAFLMSAITCLPVLRGVFHAVLFLMTA
ncbi:hypothetical protein [Escherichia coli]|uniref:hypothetical protein n=1 Tax=Escherichia coli TaxID=562 RepID=UPI002FCD415F